MARKRRSKRFQQSKRIRNKSKRELAKRRGRRVDREKNPCYARWREDVKTRDSHCCQWPNCGCKHRIQVHHIKTWAKYPALRYVVANGITLCERCHELLKGKEANYEAFLLKLLEYQLISKLRLRKRKA